MYETIEHWKQYKQDKELQTKIAKEFNLDEAVLEVEKKANWKEFDKWMKDLIADNGTTKYQYDQK